MNINQIGTINVKERKVVNAYAHPYGSFVRDLLKKKTILGAINNELYTAQVKSIATAKVSL